MKNLLLITFDICRLGEPTTAFSAGSIVSSLQSHPAYGDKFVLNHVSYNLFDAPGKDIAWKSETIAWHQYDFIAISCYIWSHKQALSLMKWIKTNRFDATVIAGGYQINSTNVETLNSLYPDADFFITGYAEKALEEIVLGNTDASVVKVSPNWDQQPSPFLSGVIKVDASVRSLRMESKRGCPYACTFCAQHEVGRPQTHFYLPERLEAELDFVKAKGIQRVSVTDPVFNMGNTYLRFLQYIDSLGLRGVFNFQVRPELISRKNDIKFLDLLAATNSEVELGIQTFDPVVNQIIKRKNQYGPIDEALKAFLEHEIQFGISLIYGLPGQTLDSFKKDIDKVSDLGIRNVIAFPLMLLPGTELYAMRGNEKIKELVIGDYGIPHVIASSSFSETEWMEMNRLADLLNPNNRLF